MAPPTFSILILNALGSDRPALLVIILSIFVGLLMVVIFRYTSDQKAIRVAKDQLKAHLLAVRLFQDQLGVVLSSYGRIIRSTGRYLRLAFKPLLFVAIPLTILIVQLDRYLGWTPIPVGQAFMVKAHAAEGDALDAIQINLPRELSTTAPAVHIAESREVVWRLVARQSGHYHVEIGGSGEALSKTICVASGLDRVSPVRLKDRSWERWFVSGEPALPANSPIQSIEVVYPARNIRFLGFDWNWIWLFFVLSLAAGFLFKTIFGIEI